MRLAPAASAACRSAEIPGPRRAWPHVVAERAQRRERNRLSARRPGELDRQNFGEGAAHPVERGVAGKILATQHRQARGGRLSLGGSAAAGGQRQHRQKRAEARKRRAGRHSRLGYRTRGSSAISSLNSGNSRRFAELGILHQFLFVLEAFFERLADILQRAVVHARLGIGLRQVVVKFGALLRRCAPEQHTVSAVVLEDVLVQREGRLIGLGGFLIFLAREIRRAQVAVDRSGVREKASAPAGNTTMAFR